MKVAIVGSRGLQIDLSRYIPPETTEIISGGAKGIDTLAEQYAIQKGIPTRIFYPDIKVLGRWAYFARNDQIVDAADLVIAFWDGASPGTRYTIARARKMNKPVRVHLFREGEIMR